MTDELEEMNADDRSVAEALGAMPRISAPADFNHKVRGRIAARRQHSGQGWRILVPAFAVVFLAALGTVLYLGVLNSANVTDVPPIAEAPAQAPMPPAATPVTQSDAPAPPEVASAVSDDTSVPNERTAERTVPKRQPVRNEDFEEVPPGGSIDRAGSPVNTAPDRTVNSNVAVPEMRPPGFDSPGEVEANEVLSLLGLKGNFQPEGFLVGSAEASGAAARAGVRAGDVVESLDGKNIEPETRFASGSEIRTIGVKRNGERLTLRINR